MAFQNGYTGRVLRINLSTESIRTIEGAYVEDRERFIGGSGLAAKVLFDELKPKTDPLGQDNLLIFMAGPLTGTSWPSTRYAVVCKSPLTGMYGEATASGHWGPQLKMAGYDGMILEGRAENPVYIWVSDGEVEIRDASHLWGMKVHEVGEALKREIKESGFKALTIGPAGERLAGIAAIIECYHGSACARCGVGAVMGSKNLKAIAARGTSIVGVAKEEEYKAVLRNGLVTLTQNSEGMRKYGTPGGTAPAELTGDLPIKNWSVNSWRNEVEKISGETYAATILKKPAACHRCSVACKREIEVKEGPYKGVEGHGPEYETVAGFGSLLLNDNLGSIAYANALCTAYGMDTISCGGVVAFAAECYEHGIITKNDTEGLSLEWGNHKDLVSLVELIGERRGIGKLLGDGSKVASQKLGRGSERFAINVKGMELPAHDPRAYESLALGYATANRGADHLTACSHWVERSTKIPELGYLSTLDRFTTDGKAELVAKMQNYMAVLDSLALCKFDLFCGTTYTHIANALSAVTGIDWTVEKLQKTGEKIYNLKRMFNVREGVSRKDDTLPERILTKPIVQGGTKDHVPNLERMLNEYYEIRGWDEQGVPMEETLERLGLS
jgi:aldehyde:ferredoxin oxidoreductase